MFNNKQQIEGPSFTSKLGIVALYGFIFWPILKLFSSNKKVTQKQIDQQVINEINMFFENKAKRKNIRNIK